MKNLRILISSSGLELRRREFKPKHYALEAGGKEPVAVTPKDIYETLISKKVIPDNVNIYT